MLIKVYTDFITRQEKSQEKICRSLKTIYVRGNVIIADFSRCNSALQEYNIKRIANFTHSLIECVKINLNEGINENHTLKTARTVMTAAVFQSAVTQLFPLFQR